MSTPSPIDAYGAAFASARPGRASEPAFLRDLREAAITRFQERGFPGRKEEGWRSTRVDRVASRHHAEMAAGGNGLPAGGAAGLAHAPEGAICLAFVNGRHAPELSSPGGLPRGVVVGSLADLVAHDPEAVEPHLGRLAVFEDHPFVALNTAFFRDGALVRVPRGTVVDAPIFLVHLVEEPAGAAVTHPRSLILLEEGAQATVVETYLGLSGSDYWSNPVTEIACGQGASLVHVKVQREGQAASHFGTTASHLQRDASISSQSISLGGRLVRHDVTATLNAEGADCTLNGLYVLADEQHEEDHTLIDHARPHGTSRELYKGILGGRARGVFHGGIRVREDAQKTDARQTNKNLLLSDDALVDTKPQLEIYADDVKCAHGATVGQLDEDSLFYLRARGIDRQQARDILIHAFAREILDGIPVEALRAGLVAELAGRLPAGAGEAS